MSSADKPRAVFQIRDDGHTLRICFIPQRNIIKALVLSIIMAGMCGYIAYLLGSGRWADPPMQKWFAGMAFCELMLPVMLLHHFFGRDVVIVDPAGIVLRRELWKWGLTLNHPGDLIALVPLPEREGPGLFNKVLHAQSLCFLVRGREFPLGHGLSREDRRRLEGLIMELNFNLEVA
jgi:hypothetical protein